MVKHTVLIAAVVWTGIAQEPACGQKLRGLRERVRVESPKSRPKSRDESADADRKQDEEDEATEAKSRRSGERKLREISGRVHGPTPVARESGARRDRGRDHSRRQNTRRPFVQNRSPRWAMHFNGIDRAFRPERCPPTFVEEYHFYQQDPILVETQVAPTPAVVGVIDQPAYASQTFATLDSDVPVETWSSGLSPARVLFGIDYAADIDEVTRFGFGLLAHKTGGLGIDTGVRLFRERYEDVSDHLWIGDFNLVYEFFPTDVVRPRAGIGVNWLADSIGAEAGLNLTVGADVQFRPVTISGEIDLGTLGDTDLFHGRVTAGVLQNDHLEWFAGYDYLDIGGVETRGVVGGIRVRF